MPLSYEETAPNYAFKKARREDQAKVFLGDLTVQENMAKGSPGPVYKYEDQIKYKDVINCNGYCFFIGPQVRFLTSPESAPIEAKVRLLRERDIP